MIDPVTLNAANPSDDANGHAMLNRMNERHQPLYRWGWDHIALDGIRRVLDIGFGGGRSIRNLSGMLPDAHFFGIDYSQASYKKCAEINGDLIADGRLKITVGSAETLPYEKDDFDLVTAFETVYYWPNIEKCFRNVWKTLKEGGAFLICNEDCSREGNEEIADALNMRFYSRTDLENVLRCAGFQTVRTDCSGSWVCAVGQK